MIPNVLGLSELYKSFALDKRYGEQIIYMYFYRVTDLFVINVGALLKIFTFFGVFKSGAFL